MSLYIRLTASVHCDYTSAETLGGCSQCPPFFFCSSNEQALQAIREAGDSCFPYPHELRLICLRLYWHCRTIRNIVQSFVSSVVESLSRMILPSIVWHLVVSLSDKNNSLKSASISANRPRLESGDVDLLALQQQQRSSEYI